ncbi:MAG: hypothetical protein E6J62_09720 [Deltaproteobacteria bacterium]|nr:MAG: hypothetical protein E6J85_05940 [Deltaproteobacteria bacterium]TMB35190.1 MAG: hypothetical protein E6J62_09720 [Deltaproteobacteria bacterium]
MGEPVGGGDGCFVRRRRLRCHRSGLRLLGSCLDGRRRFDLDWLRLERGLLGRRNIDGCGGLLLDFVRLRQRDREVVLDGDLHFDICLGNRLLGGLLGRRAPVGRGLDGGLRRFGGGLGHHDRSGRFALRR